jgi:hypothetical protein
MFVVSPSFIHLFTSSFIVMVYLLRLREVTLVLCKG